MPRAATRDVFRHGVVSLLVVHLAGRGVKAGPFADDGLERGRVVEVDIRRRRFKSQKILVAEHFALAGLGQNDEFVAEIAADRPRFRRHRDRGQPHPREGAQISDEHLVVGMAAGLRVEIEGIGVLHQKFARAHDAEARAHLVAEFPLDMEQVKRQVLVGAHIGADDLGDHLLIGRADRASRGRAGRRCAAFPCHRRRSAPIRATDRRVGSSASALRSRRRGSAPRG